MTGRKNPYIRIIEAARAGRGVKLSARDCRYMQWDAAIEQVAINTAEGIEVNGGGFFVTKEGFEDKE